MDMAFSPRLEHGELYNPYCSDPTEDVSDLYACSNTDGADFTVDEFGHFFLSMCQPQQIIQI
jgi:hypothetical protein